MNYAQPINSRDQQPSLALSLRDHATFNNFYAGKNQLLLNTLKTFLQTPTDPFLYFWGPKGSGKTHLLQACCHLCAQQGLRVSFIPLNAHTDLSPDILTDIETMDLVCIDDVEAVQGKHAWELALFNAYNRLKDPNSLMVMTGQSAVKNIGFALADLSSRLTAGVSLQLYALSDEQKQAALKQRAQQRGMPLSDQVAEYLLTHYQRDTATLFAALDILDQKSIQAKRKLTIPFVKTCLETA